MKCILSTLAIFALIAIGTTAEAQRGGGARGARGGPPGDRGGGVANQQLRNQFGNQAIGNQAFGNQNGNQQPPSPAELATMFIGNFDADGSGELNQAELQSALTALQQQMMNQRGGQGQGNMQAAAAQNAFGNNQNALQNQDNFRGNQNQFGRVRGGQRGRR